MSLKEMTKTAEKFTLREPITPEELFDLMNRGGIVFPGMFRLKKGLFSKSIVFDVVMQIQPRVKVKDNVVIVRKIRSSTKISVGGMPGVDIRATGQRLQAAQEGGLGKAFTGGIDYFLNVIEAMRALLQNLM